MRSEGSADELDPTVGWSEKPIIPNDVVRFRVKGSRALSKEDDEKKPIELRVIREAELGPTFKQPKAKEPEPKLKEVPEEAKPIDEAWLVILAVLAGGIFFLVTATGWFSYALAALAFTVSGLGAYILLRRRR